MGELAKATGTGAVAGGLTGAATGLVSVGAGRFSSLAGLSKVLAAPGVTGHLARIGFGGVTGTLANGTTEAIFNGGQVDWKKAAESGLGMAILGDAWQSGKGLLRPARVAAVDLPDDLGPSGSPAHTDDSANDEVGHVTGVPEQGAGAVVHGPTETSVAAAENLAPENVTGRTADPAHMGVHKPPPAPVDAPRVDAPRVQEPPAALRVDAPRVDAPRVDAPPAPGWTRR